MAQRQTRERPPEPKPESTPESTSGNGQATQATTQERSQPAKPSELSAPSWWGVLRRSVREFKNDNLSDWAAALTYYAVLAMFPALIALIAVVGLVGQYPETTNALLRIVGKLGPHSAVNT